MNTLEATAAPTTPSPTDRLTDLPTHGLLNELVITLQQYVILPPHAAETLALWTLHTYAFHLRDVSTYLGIESPEKRCGKTTLLTVLSELCNRAIVSSNISSPAFFRVIEETRPTLLIDEADTFLQTNDELRGILNCGYTKKTAHVIRVINQPASGSPLPSQEGRGAKGEGSNFSLPTHRLTHSPTHTSSPTHRLTDSPTHATSAIAAPTPPLPSQEGRGARGEGSNPSLPTHRLTDSPTYASSPFSTQNRLSPSLITSHSSLATFSTWCPKAIAAIGHLPETLADRCIVIRMQRKTNHEQTRRLRTLETTNLRQQCEAFVATHANEIATAQPEIPKELNDRAADIWEPLFALADIAGGDWPEKSRRAAIALSTRASENNPIGALLMDLLIYFARPQIDRAFTRDIVEYLQHMGIRPWNENLKKPVTDLWLAQQLRPYGIRARNIRIDGAQAKGYVQDEMLDAFRRYIPKTEIDRIHEDFASNEEAEEPKSEPSA